MGNGLEAVTCGEAMPVLPAEPEPGVPLERAVHAVHFRRAVAGAESDVSTVIKRPDRSAEAISGGERCVQPHFPVPVVDPVGAGDAFAAGYLSAWLRGLPPGQALAEAATLGALAVQCAADTDALPSATGRDAALAAFRAGNSAVLR